MRASLLILLLTPLACGDDDRPEPPPDCASLAGCRDDGLCTAVEEVCVAVSDADCQQLSEVCTQLGRCTAKEGKCVATSDADCEASSWCEIYGGCHAKDGVCLALSDKDCKKSSGCKLYGWCTVNLEGECVKVLP